MRSAIHLNSAAAMVPFIFTRLPGQDPGKGDRHRGFGKSVHKAVGILMFNLDEYPQESDHVGIRHIPMDVPLNEEYTRDQQALEKYPGTVQISIGSN